MRSTRVLLDRLSAGAVGGAEDGAEVVLDADAITYADVFVVVREGESGPGPNDWEVTLETCRDQHLRPGEHDLRLETLDGSRLSGRALLRFSDGTRHLFRGDGRLTGFVDAP
ncbi:MAG TPA: hypothetical protein VF015_14405 [Acidimicrobiales bacterium]